MGKTEGQGELLRYSWRPPARVPLFHVDDGSHDFLAGSLRARLPRPLGREEPAILPLYQRSMKAQHSRRLEDDRGPDHPARVHEERTQAGDHAIRRTEMGRPFSRTIEDQQLVLDEHGFGHHGPGAAGAGEPGDGRQQMQKQDGQIARGTILQDREILRNAHKSTIRHVQGRSIRRPPHVPPPVLTAKEFEPSCRGWPDGNSYRTSCRGRSNSRILCTR